jgi:hypothetical protein
MKKRPILFLVALFLFPSTCLAEKIQGHACYTYGDNESLVQAEHTAKMLAIRNAIESCTIFIESTSKITDFQLTSDLIKAVSAGQVKGVKELKRLQSGRTICYTIEGFVDPNEMHTAINNFLEGKSEDVRLQENGWIRIISHFVQKETHEEFNKRILGDSYKTPEWEKNLLIRMLRVKIQFLKPCTATTHKPDELSFIPGEQNSPEASAWFIMNLNRLAYESKTMSIKEFKEANVTFQTSQEKKGVSLTPGKTYFLSANDWQSASAL